MAFLRARQADYTAHAQHTPPLGRDRVYGLDNLLCATPL